MLAECISWQIHFRSQSNISSLVRVSNPSRQIHVQSFKPFHVICLFLYPLATREPRGFFYVLTQPEITCSKLAIEILEQGVKYVHS